MEAIFIVLILIIFFFVAEFLKAILELVKIIVPVVFICSLGFVFLQNSFATTDGGTYPEQPSINPTPYEGEHTEASEVDTNQPEISVPSGSIDTVIVYIDSNGKVLSL